MIRRALQSAAFFMSIWMIVWGSNTLANAQTSAALCKREDLKRLVNQYFQALEMHNASSLPLASNVKYTENGVELAVGAGFWQTAGKPLLRRGLVDTLKCGTHTQAVMQENGKPILYGFRLKVDNARITEIESIIAREKEFAFKVDGVLATKDQDWETILPPEQRSSRLAMIAAADDYFDMFTKEPYVRTPFASPCDRWENGTQTTAGGPFAGKDYIPHDCSPKGLVITTHGKRRFLVDTEAGIVVAYVLFAGGLPDFHMFKMRNGKVELVQAVIGAGAKSMGWPDEAVCK